MHYFLLCSSSDISISSVVPGDYDGDSQMDVLLTAHPKHTTGPVETIVYIFWGHNQTLSKALYEYIKEISMV